MRIKLFTNTNLPKVKKSLPAIIKAVRAENSRIITTNPDTVFVAGGDGWLLKSLSLLHNKKINIFFFPMGENTHTPGYKIKDIRGIISGKVSAFPHDLLMLETYRPAFNDIVFRTGRVCRTLIYKVTVNGREYITEGDGVILSTPLGTEAYNKAAGGPVIPIGTKKTVITPLLPFKGHKKSITVTTPAEITVSLLKTQGDVWETHDGQNIRAAGKKISVKQKNTLCKLMLPAEAVKKKREK